MGHLGLLGREGGGLGNAPRTTEFCVSQSRGRLGGTSGKPMVGLAWPALGFWSVGLP